MLGITRQQVGGSRASRFVEKKDGGAPTWRSGTHCPNALRGAASNGNPRCAVHQNAKVKPLFSPQPVNDSVDNRVGISLEPHSAWLPLGCLANEQAKLQFCFCRIQPTSKFDTTGGQPRPPRRADKLRPLQLSSF